MRAIIDPYFYCMRGQDLVEEVVRSNLFSEMLLWSAAHTLSDHFLKVKEVFKGINHEEASFE
jgi:hypothetical protein